jgi:hypothetical protein
MTVDQADFIERSGEEAAMMTQEEVNRLPTGAVVEITWSGGNGPHRYVVERHFETVCARMRPFGTDHPYRLEAIRPVGKKPLTVVNLISVP